MDIREVQTALKKQGFDPGEIDGAWGRRSIAALKAFQQARGLVADGIAGPRTLAALTGDGAQPTPGGNGGNGGNGGPLVWYEEARRLVGTREVVGTGSNPDIIKWARRLNIDYKDDDIPWCGLFVAHCLGSTLPEERLPGGPLGARNWAKFGQHCDPVQGALGHVGFYQSEDDKAYHVLGGNQSNAVNTARVGKERLLDARWPATAASLQGNKVMAKGSGKLSHNEA
jgi:uncharacterized protein (TIGR02594 family)